MADFVELTKPRITLLVLITTVVGFYMGSSGGLQIVLLLHTIVGSALIASGASALNQYVERDLDARMQRTRTRPLPGGRLLPSEALAFSTLLSVAGGLYLLVFVNPLTALLGALTLLAYIFVYTPLKTRSSWCTLVGAFPGAVPPLMGYAGAHGGLDAGAWSLFAILLLWQMPHFFAIAWIFTEDYERGGFVVHSRGQSASRQIILYGSALIPVSLLPAVFHIAGVYYMWGALLLGFLYLGYGVAVALFRSNTHAQRLLRMSVIYLPALLALMTLDKK